MVRISWPKFPREPVCECDDDRDSGYGRGVTVAVACYGCVTWEKKVTDVALSFVADAMDATEQGLEVQPEASACIGSESESREQFLYMTALLLGATGDALIPLVPTGYSEACDMPQLTYEAWHVVSDRPEDSAISGGFCYLAAIQPQFRSIVRNMLGAWPAFYKLLCVDAAWFESDLVLTELLAMTDDLLQPFDYEIGYPLLEALVCVAHAMVPVVLGDSMHARLIQRENTLVSRGAAVPMPHCAVGGVKPRWHVSIGFENVSHDSVGYCYLSLFMRALRPKMRQQLGAWPTLERIMSMPYGSLVGKKRLRYLLFVDTAVEERPMAINTYSAMITAACVIKSDDNSTIAGRLYKYCKSSLDKKVLSPMPADLIGGSYRGPEESVDLIHADKLGYKPIIADVDAEWVIDSTMKEWGLPAEDNAIKDETLTALATVFVSGSNNYAVAAATVVVQGACYSCSVLCNQASRVVTANNSVRMWVKSYRYGEMVLRISDLLDTPENTALRNRAMFKYGVAPDLVHMCFDTTSVLRHLRPMSRTETVFMRVAYRLRSRPYPPKDYWSRFVGGSTSFHYVM